MSLIRRRRVLIALLSAGILMVPLTAAPPENDDAPGSHSVSILDQSSSVVSDDDLNGALDSLNTGFDGSELEGHELEGHELVGHELVGSENADSEFDEYESRSVLERKPERKPERKLVAEPESPTPVAEPINLTQEKIQERYPDGKIHIERWVTLDELGNFVNHGPWKQLNRDGQIIKSGSWNLGQRDGKWIQTLNNVQASRLSTNLRSFQSPFTSTAQFKDGRLDGTWIISDQRKNTVVSWEYVADQRSGVSVWFTPDGNKRLQISYTDNKPSGAMFVWNGSDDEQPKQYELVGGMELKTETKWHGKTKRQKEEEFTYLVPSTMQIASQSWNASHLQYVENTDAEPVRHGGYVRWYRNGVLAHKGNYQFGEPSGEAEWWHPNGQRQVAGAYVDGRPSGQWLWWHDSGMRKISGEYYAGTQVGLWRSWSEKGQLAAVEQKLEAEQVIASEQPTFENQYSEFEQPEDRVSTLNGPIGR